MSEPEFSEALEIWQVLGRRWTLAILQALETTNIQRFTELKRSLPGISGTMLSERLLELEVEDLVARTVYCSVPPKVEYRLTAGARDLIVLMRQVCSWNMRRKSQRSMYRLIEPASPLI